MVQTRAAKARAAQTSAATAKNLEPSANLNNLPIELLYNIQNIAQNVHLDQVSTDFRSIFGAETNRRRLCTHYFQQIPYPITVDVMLNLPLQDEHREAILKLINRDWFLSEFSKPMGDRSKEFFISEKYIEGWMGTAIGLKTWAAPDKWTQKHGDFVLFLADRFSTAFRKSFVPFQPFVPQTRIQALVAAIEQGCAPAIALLGCFGWKKTNDDQDPGLGDVVVSVDRYTGKSYVPKGRWTSESVGPDYPWSCNKPRLFRIRNVDHGEILNAALANRKRFPELLDALIVATLKRLFCNFEIGMLIWQLSHKTRRELRLKLKNIHPELRRFKSSIQKLMKLTESTNVGPGAARADQTIMQDTSLEDFEAQVVPPL